MFKIAYSKPNKWFVAKSFKEEKNYEYVKYIFRKIIKRVNAGKKSSKSIGRKGSYVCELPQESEHPEKK